MEKNTIEKFGKHYLLGENQEGEKVYLEAPKWDCGWYWGFGYLHTFTNNINPEKSKDINAHFHFDSTFLEKDIYNSYVEYFKISVLKEKEIWQLLELMQQAYIIRKAADTYHRGDAHISTANGIDQMPVMAQELNKDLELVIFPAIEKLLTISE